MKATKYFLILLTLVAMFTFACKAEEQDVEEPTDQTTVMETVDPIDDWAGKLKTLVEEWEAKAATGTKMTQADLEAFVAAKTPLMEAMKTMDLTNVTEAQTATITDLNARRDKLINTTIPGMMK